MFYLSQNNKNNAKIIDIETYKIDPLVDPYECSLAFFGKFNQ